MQGEGRSPSSSAHEQSGWKHLVMLARERISVAGVGAVGVAIGGGLLILAFTVLRLTARGALAVDQVSDLRPDLPWTEWCLRLPLSAFAPAPRLPVWGAVAQVVLVMALAELLVGRRRLLVAAATGHVLASCVGRPVATDAMGFGALAPSSFAAVRDTGPSAAVVALAVGLAVGSRIPAVAVAVTALLTLDAAATPTLAGVEHLAAIAVGAAVGWWWLRHRTIDATAPAPTRVDDRRRFRRTAAFVVGVAGLVDVVHALVGRAARPVMRRGLDGWPFTVSASHREFAAVLGVALLLAARGLRRGQQIAWSMVLALAFTRVLVPPRRAFDVVEITCTLLLGLALLVHRRSFGAPGRMRATRQGASVLVASVAGTCGVAALVARALAHRGGTEPYGRVLLAVVERLLDIDTIVLPNPIERGLGPWLGLAGALLIGTAVWLLTRPAVGRLGNDGATRERARRCVERWGGDTLAWFALRDDKTVFFSGESMVAYTVMGATALVSPDPVGPPGERGDVWSAFRSFAHDQGWSAVVLGASSDWLPYYLAADMHAMYIGDEAIVDVGGFTLAGGRMKGLRQAAARVARHGYTVTFHDPSQLEPEVCSRLTELATMSRRGHGERGYSMTLGRFFQPDDRGMLLAVCRDAQGLPVAFCQYVPAPGIGGWSLDAMRRDRGEHPNGLLDFVIVETIERLRREGSRGLCLNFAAMRSVLADDAATGLGRRALRWLLRKGSETMQIESLWRYNAKFDPSWAARYAVFESVADVPDALVAVARAESVWELPLVGRLLRARSRAATPEGAELEHESALVPTSGCRV